MPKPWDQVEMDITAMKMEMTENAWVTSSSMRAVASSGPIVSRYPNGSLSSTAGRSTRGMVPWFPNLQTREEAGSFPHEPRNEIEAGVWGA